ncbi:hypothetical protein BaRGS_00003302 [Batillaria attramentaria]|uniref:Uncharacterized protein n=1 Tax=Batillaria attramentaria TaxID=370345 RepID=A0ABD0M2Z0_9CAEN
MVAETQPSGLLPSPTTPVSFTLTAQLQLAMNESEQRKRQKALARCQQQNSPRHRQSTERQKPQAEDVSSSTTSESNSVDADVSVLGNPSFQPLMQLRRQVGSVGGRSVPPRFGFAVAAETGVIHFMASGPVATEKQLSNKTFTPHAKEQHSKHDTESRDRAELPTRAVACISIDKTN